MFDVGPRDWTRAADNIGQKTKLWDWSCSTGGEMKQRLFVLGCIKVPSGAGTSEIPA
jgi:hypothetical protein